MIVINTSGLVVRFLHELVLFYIILEPGTRRWITCLKIACLLSHANEIYLQRIVLILRKLLDHHYSNQRHAEVCRNTTPDCKLPDPLKTFKFALKDHLLHLENCNISPNHND